MIITHGTRVMYRLPLFSFCLVMTLSACGAQVLSVESQDRARDQMKAAVASGEVAGAGQLVVRDGKVLFQNYVGVTDLEGKTPFGPRTIIRIYSMTKPITSVAAMLLFEQGKFSLDDPVAKFIPAFEHTLVWTPDGDTRTRPARTSMTVRDVFRHTTGYAYDGGQDAELQEYYRREGMLYRPPSEMMPPQMTIANAADALARIPALHDPGKKFTYGYSTDLLGRLIEVWSGKPLDEFMNEAVFEPLEMEDTAFSVPQYKRGRFASCHTTVGGKLAVIDKFDTSPFADGFEFLSGGGGLLSTVTDYSHFCEMMADHGSYRGKRLLQESTVNLMYSDQLNGAAGEFRFGLGFAINDVELGAGQQRRLAREYSWGGYASTAFRILPDERFFQIVVRQHVPQSQRLVKELIATVYEGFEQPVIPVSNDQ